jgi:streptogramin lyase
MRARFSRRSLARVVLGSSIGLLAMLILPGAAMAIDEFPLTNPCPPAPLGGTCQPAGIAAGPDGRVWFTEEAGNRIGAITTSGVFSEYTSGLSPGGQPTKITAGPDGRLWFTEPGVNRIGAITTSGVITEYPGAGSQPDGIAAGPDGNLWFTEVGGDAVRRITTAGSISSPFSVGAGSDPGDITAGPDNRLWFTQSNDVTGASQIGAITTTGTFTPYALAPFRDPSGITSTGGALFFTEFGANLIGRISTTGAISEFPDGGGQPSGIATGSDGALWFTETSTNKIGRMTTTGTLTNEFPIATAGSQPGDIAPGPDGALWFTEFVGNKIGRIAVAPPAPPPPPPPPAPPTVKASVLSLRLSPSAFKAAPKGSSISKRVRPGTTVTYRLSVAGSARFTVERETAGRKKGKRCVKATPKNRRAKRCKLYLAVRGSFSHKGKAGNNRFHFSGRVSNKKLRPGRYRLVATIGTSKSNPKRANFRIVR